MLYGLKKGISGLTALAVLLWLVPVLPVLHAANIENGDIIRCSTLEGVEGYKVYIVWESYKRHIYDPEVFNMYGHLMWENVEEVTSTELDSYTTSDLYSVDVQPEVYKVDSDGVKHHLSMTAAEFILAGYSWAQIFVINENEGGFIKGSKG